MNKHIILFLSVVFIIFLLGFLYLKVQHLEAVRKEVLGLPAGTLQTSTGPLKEVSPDDYMLGNKSAPITLIEYSDFECPSCQMMHPVFDQLIKAYENNVLFIARMFPLPQNVNAQKEAEAALCAGNIGGSDIFWKYGNEIFKRTKGTEGGTGFALDKLVPLAKELGINEKKFADCLDTNKMAHNVQQEESDGEVAGVHQLPTLFVVDKHGKAFVISGVQSLQTLKIIVDQALANN